MLKEVLKKRRTLNVEECDHTFRNAAVLLGRCQELKPTSPFLAVPLIAGNDSDANMDGAAARLYLDQEKREKR